LHNVLKEHGVHSYSIFFEHDTNRLFAYVEIESEAVVAANREHPGLQTVVGAPERTNGDEFDNSPVKDELEEVFRSTYFR